MTKVSADAGLVATTMTMVRCALAEVDRRPIMIGICGGQGSGKSTLAAALEERCGKDGVLAARLSIDDLYFTRDQRSALARSVHPLFQTRGVPGTHDIQLGLHLIRAMEAGSAVKLPRFDKAADDRAPQCEWPSSPAGCDVLILEGWCVGAVPQPENDLAAPVNLLEATEDAQAIWRTYANTALGGIYQALFRRIDRLMLLAAPDFDVIFRWRLQQEQELAERSERKANIMDVGAIGRFVAHYERLTHFILDEMPSRANLTIRLDHQRRVLSTNLRV